MTEQSDFSNRNGRIAKACKDPISWLAYQQLSMFASRSTIPFRVKPEAGPWAEPSTSVIETVTSTAAAKATVSSSLAQPACA